MGPQGLPIPKAFFRLLFSPSSWVGVGALAILVLTWRDSAGSPYWLSIHYAHLSQSQGQGFASTATNVGGGWGSPSNATGPNDDTCASVAGANRSLDLKGVGLSIPSTASIVGLQIEAKAARSASGTIVATLLKGGTPTGAAATLTPTLANDCTSSVYATVGGTGDPWGASSTPPHF